MINWIKTLCLASITCLLAGCETPNERAHAFATADYGPPPPENYQEVVKESILRILKDPESARLRFLEPEKARLRANGFSDWEYLWVTKVWVNAKNSYGGYAGEQPYWYYWRDGEIVKATSGSTVPEYEWGAAAR